MRAHFSPATVFTLIPAAGLIFQSRNYGRVYWNGGFIREAGLLFQYYQRGGAIIFSTFVSKVCDGM